LKASNPKDDVLLPGEVRWKHLDRNTNSGLLISPSAIADLVAISKRYGVKIPWNSSK
jgi:LDH2 family malate/lactate/ureidoglycolate dehydrogenase